MGIMKILTEYVINWQQLFIYKIQKLSNLQLSWEKLNFKTQ